MPRPDAEPIASLQNPQVRLARALLEAQGRRRQGAFMVEGLRLVEAASDASAPQLVLHTPAFGRHDPRERRLLQRLRAAGAAVRLVTEQVLAYVTDTVTPQGIVAVVPLPGAAGSARPAAGRNGAALAPTTGGQLALILDGVNDPGNAGTLLRSAAAAGVTQVIAPRGTVDLYAPKVVRAGAGAHFSVTLLPGLSWDDVRGLLPASGQVLLADAGAPTPYWEVDWTRAAALIVSNEAHGPSAAARALATGTVAIPIHHVESLNAGVAGSVILFEAVRQRTCREQVTSTPDAGHRAAQHHPKSDAGTASPGTQTERK
jgi:TrmH family RNA methyltransferase